MHSASNWAAWLLQEVGQKVAMHAVAMKPRYLSPDTVPVEALEGIPSSMPHAMYQAHHELESNLLLLLLLYHYHHLYCYHSFLHVHVCGNL